MNGDTYTVVTKFWDGSEGKMEGLSDEEASFAVSHTLLARDIVSITITRDPADCDESGEYRGPGCDATCGC